MPIGLAFECHLNTRQPKHLNTRQMDAILLSYVLVWYSNGWSSTRNITHWNTEPFEIPISKSLVFKWSVFRSPLYLKPVVSLLIQCVCSMWVCPLTRWAFLWFETNRNYKIIFFINRRLSRCKQLGGLIPVVRLGVPLRYKASKSGYPLLFSEYKTLPWHTYLYPNFSV